MDGHKWLKAELWPNFFVVLRGGKGWNFCLFFIVASVTVREIHSETLVITADTETEEKSPNRDTSFSESSQRGNFPVCVFGAGLVSLSLLERLFITLFLCPTK